MMRSKLVHGLGALLVGAIAWVAAVPPAQAVNIAWDKNGAFESCLERQASDWINAKAALVANDDPAAGDFDDMDVALWTAAALERCEIQSGRGSQTSEFRFTRYMAHWREHIHTVAQTVRDRVRAD
jgi:hypothetical protein